jgi:hypothetical protein
MPKVTYLKRIKTYLNQYTIQRQERLEHNSAMADPKVLNEHQIARGRAVSAGEPDCRYCQNLAI